jgi:type II secretory pathway pseudopilin PulG
VELLVVITILAIISVVAYQSFGWATDKAISARKISDVSTIESSLQQYKVDKNAYPAVDIRSDNNMWGYNSWTVATPSNTISVTLNWAEIASLDGAEWGWKVLNGSWQQIGAKWTISQSILWKQYLTKDLYDPEIWDLKVNAWWKLIDKWIWRYVYAVYRKPTWNEWSDNWTWTYYNIAYTVKKEWSDTYLTKIVWDYDSDSCFDDEDICPNTLIWSWGKILIDWQEQWKDKDGKTLDSDYGSAQENQWIPYSVDALE